MIQNCILGYLPKENKNTNVKRYICSKVHSRIIYNSQAMEVMFSSFQLLSHVWFFATQWTAARQASLTITNSQSPPKLMSIESVMPSNHFILCRPLFPLPLIFPSIRVFSNESALCIRWPKYWSFSFNNMNNIFAIIWMDLEGMLSC